MTFEDWMNEVSSLMEDVAGVSPDDIADVDYYSLWEDDIDPVDAVDEILAYEGYNGEN